VEAEPRIYGVGELLAELRALLEERIGRVWVVGEVSNLRAPASGHVYFSLVDERGQLRAALFRGVAQRLGFDLEDGMEVLAYGDLTVYEPRGDLQIIVRQLEPRGLGALQLAFEQLRRRLEAEGLFDAGRKRALPYLPTRIGVVTSGTGAALRDVIQVTGRRLPSVPLLLAPARVQGAGAEQEIAAALDSLSQREDVSVILLVRGGGSLEDLQPFNTECVARAIARSRVPVISGVGHEVDVTIADLVADVRAPTPSAAAELALPDRGALRQALAAASRRLRRVLAGRVADWSQRLARESEALRMQAPTARVTAQRQRFAAAGRALRRAMAACSESARARLSRCAGQLDSLSPLAVLGRGYALVRRARDGAIVRSEADAPAGERIAIRLAAADLEARVELARTRPPAVKTL
jgi:exodeoxyribonuclease VII large subunit